MSILIKGMEMPIDCCDCPMFGDYKMCCSLMPGVSEYSAEFTDAIKTNRRHKDCPLIPVSPHGDLIDASTKVTIQIYDDMYEEFHDEECTIADVLDRWSNEGCPKAIIPAEEERTDERFY